MFIFVSTDEKFHFSFISRFSFSLSPLEVSDFDHKIVVNFIIYIIDNLQNYKNQCWYCFYIIMEIFVDTAFNIIININFY
jgi:hypothetical protein